MAKLPPTLPLELPPTLEALPTEILLEIIKKFRLDPKVLINLACCCRQFHGLVMPQLYRDVSFDCANIEHIKGFACTILQHPSLASYVKTFTCHYPEPDHPGGLITPDHFFRPFQKQPKKPREADLGQLKEEFWRLNLLNNESDNDVLDIIIPTLTQLTWLNLEYFGSLVASYCSGADYFKKIPILACYGPRSLDHLTHLLTTFSERATNESWKCDNTWRHGISYHDAALIFQLHTLQAFAGTMRRPDAGSVWEKYKMESYRSLMANDQSILTLRDLPARSSAITYLELRDINMDPDDLTYMVRACTSLRTFLLEWTISGEEVKFDTDKLGRCFESAKSSLETLSLEYCWNGEWFNDSLVKAVKPIAPLTEFVSIKSLRLGMLYVFGGREDESNKGLREGDITRHCAVLPPNVEVLYLTCIQRNPGSYPWLEYIDKVLDVSREHFPRLNSIQIEMSRGGWKSYVKGDRPQLGFNAAKDRCTTRGIS